MDLETFDGHRSSVDSAHGPISYVQIGEGARVAMFVHGVGTASYLWRNVMEDLGGGYRCIALDLPLHGHTPPRPDRPFTLAALARVVADLCEALELPPVDLVGNDTGGAVAQTFAVTYPDRVRTLTLTDCDTHDNFPPEAFKPTVELAAAGLIAPAAADLLAEPAALRATSLGTSYEHPEVVGDEVFRAYLTPVLGTPARAREFERLLLALDAAELVAIEDKLRALTTSTLIVWGTGDPLFDVKWAYWLRDTIPGADTVVEVPGGNLLHPEERPAVLASALRRFWAGA
jgi:pimeloyl-ACP methyl ester carboxylesterase